MPLRRGLLTLQESELHHRSDSVTTRLWWLNSVAIGVGDAVPHALVCRVNNNSENKAAAA